jgi:hypothetical protein
MGGGREAAAGWVEAGPWHFVASRTSVSSVNRDRAIRVGDLLC